MDADLLHQLQEIFRDTVNDDVVLEDSMTAADVDGWDSVAHVNLLFAIEERFGIEFTQAELASLSNVGDLRRTIAGKIGATSR